MGKLVTKRDWRFCVTLGLLMNTRGLVEVIALNIGLTMVRGGGAAGGGVWSGWFVVCSLCVYLYVGGGGGTVPSATSSGSLSSAGEA